MYAIFGFRNTMDGHKLIPAKARTSEDLDGSLNIAHPLDLIKDLQRNGQNYKNIKTIDYIFVRTTQDPSSGLPLISPKIFISQLGA